MSVCGFRVADQAQIVERSLELYLEVDGVRAGVSELGLVQNAAGDWVGAICVAKGEHVLRAQWLDPATEELSAWSNAIETSVPQFVPEPEAFPGLFAGLLFLLVFTTRAKKN